MPWEFGDVAVAVTRDFTRLKNPLTPYLYRAALQARDQGTPMMRAMVLEFPGDRACHHLDRQCMLGDDLLVAPVLSADGVVEYYVPACTWTRLLTGERVEGPRRRRETPGFDTLPLPARPGSVVPFGAAGERPEYDWAGGDAIKAVPATDGSTAAVSLVRRTGDTVSVEAQGERPPAAPWNVLLVGADDTGGPREPHRPSARGWACS